jgi:riboflavin synthase
MFTGLIEAEGRLARLERSGPAGRLALTAPFAGELALGDSVAVNGACLTVTTVTGDTVTFDVSPETLARTTLGTLRPGDPVNLERALRLTDRLGGHLVTGHVDCLATLAERREEAGNILIAFRLPPEQTRQLAAKGSVAVDGVSLTVNEVSSDGFTVNIIPHTAARTTLQGKRPGATVNIETDILAKYVERLLATPASPSAGGLSRELLEKSGFL